MASKFGKEFQLPAYQNLMAPTELDAEESVELASRSAGKKGAATSALPSKKSWAAVASSATSAPAARPPWGPSGSSSAALANWHEIPEAEMTPELRRDLILLENRAHLDPKRFYKSQGTGRKRGELPTRVHVGTVVEAPHEFLSGRLTNKERRKSFADEIFSDNRLMKNAKRRFSKLQETRQGTKRVVDPAAKSIRKKGRR